MNRPDRVDDFFTGEQFDLQVVQIRIARAPELGVVDRDGRCVELAGRFGHLLPVEAGRDTNGRRLRGIAGGGRCHLDLGRLDLRVDLDSPDVSCRDLFEPNCLPAARIRYSFFAESWSLTTTSILELTVQAGAFRATI